MHVLVLDTDGVDAHLLGHKLDAVVRVVQADNIAQLSDAGGALHRGGHVERCCSWRGRRELSGEGFQGSGL